MEARRNSGCDENYKKTVASIIIGLFLAKAVFRRLLLLFAVLKAKLFEVFTIKEFF
jgi:hypothetical protein